MKDVSQKQWGVKLALGTRALGTSDGMGLEEEEGATQGKPVAVSSCLLSSPLGCFRSMPDTKGSSLGNTEPPSDTY